MRPPNKVRCLLGVLLIAPLTACSVAVPGVPTAAPDPPIGRDVAEVLPSPSELSEAVGVDIAVQEFPPTLGDAHALNDWHRDATNSQCIGVTHTGSRMPYDDRPVWTVASQHWQSESGQAALVFIDVTAVVLTSDAAAADAMDSFDRQWRECDGKTVVTTGGSEDEFLNEIDDAAADGKLLTATVRWGEPDDSDPSINQRALTVRGNCIVDVAVSYRVFSGRKSAPDDLAVKVADVMLDRIDAAR